MNDLPTMPSIPLHSIKQSIRFNNESYRLAGIAKFKRPFRTRNNDNQATGHYTAVCPEMQRWVEYDDLLSSKIMLKSSTKIIFGMLIYVKEAYFR